MANFSRKTLTLAAGIVLSVMSANAQQMREGYVDFGKNASSEYFHNLLKDWAPGEQVARKAAQLNAGNVVNVHLAKAGIYVLNVKKDGKTVRTVKLIRK